LAKLPQGYIRLISHSSTPPANHVSSQREEKALDAQPFRFLGLPRELRDVIYEFTLVYEPFICVFLRNQDSAYNKETDPGDLALFRVNRQIYDEASTIFLTRNSFRIRNLAMAYEAWKSTPATVQRIRKMEIPIYEMVTSDWGIRYRYDDTSLGNFCMLFGTHGQLSWLDVIIDYQEYDDGAPLNDGDVMDMSLIPPFVDQLTQLNGLDGLKIVWDSATPLYARTMLTALKLMRTAMIEGGESFSGSKGIHLLRPHFEDTEGNGQGPIRLAGAHRDCRLILSIDKYGNRLPLSVDGSRCYHIFGAWTAERSGAKASANAETDTLTSATKSVTC
jgi:hypothetical protein